MGRPISQRFLGKTAPHQVQSTTWGAKDTGATAGYLAGQNSPRRFRTTTVNGTSLTLLANGAGNLVAGTSYVNVFPVGTEPTVLATGNATLKALGKANVVVGGIGYHVGDFLAFVGGTFNQAANVQVLANSATGAITSLSTPLNSAQGNQAYTTLPANVAYISVSGGNGSGAFVSSNFGVDQANVITGGVGYQGTHAVFVVKGETVSPTFTQPAVSGGVVTVGPVTVTSPGVINVNPSVIIESDTGTTEYLSYLQSMNYLETFQGNRYRWLHKGQTIPTDYANLGVSLAYLDTL